MQSSNTRRSDTLRVTTLQRDIWSSKIDNLSEACSRGESSNQIRERIDSGLADFAMFSGEELPTSATIASITDMFGRTALHYAAMRGRASVVTLLLDHGFDANKPETSGAYPLHLAIQCNNWNAAKILAQVTRPNARFETAILTLCKKTDHSAATEVLVELIKNEHDVNRVDKYQRNALFSAVGKPKLAKCLIEHGIDVQQKDVSNRNALFNAVYANNLEVIQLLITAGSQVDIQDYMGLTPLMIACRFGGVSIVKSLLENGGNVDTIIELDNRVMCPLSLAIEHGNYNIARFLIENYGARIDVQLHNRKVIWDLFRSITQHEEQRENVQHKNLGSMYRKHWNLYQSQEQAHAQEVLDFIMDDAAPNSKFDDLWVNLKVDLRKTEERELLDFMLETERQRKMEVLKECGLVRDLDVPGNVLSVIASPLTWH